MQHDEIIQCPKSGGDLCYKIEVNDKITSYFSLSCGFWTNTLMVPGSEFYEEQWSVLPELYKDLAWTDVNTELIWLPNNVNRPELGMVFAEGPNKDDWHWASVRAIPLTEEEKNDPKYKGQTHRTDMSTIAHFPERDYMDALDYIGALVPNQINKEVK